MTDNKYDLIVVGGGIAGVGVAWQAAKKGKRVLLLEKDELCRKTSDNSLRIIHGGLRYLQQMNIKRVLDSAREQADLMDLAPEYIKPLWCVMPLDFFSLKSRIPMWFALHFYNILRLVAGARWFNCGRVVSSKWVDQNVGLLAGQAPHGAFIWRDAIMPSDRKFAQVVIADARQHGAEFLEHTKVTSVNKLPDGGFQISAEQENSQVQFQSERVVNTCGAWLQRFRTQALFTPIKWCKAFNIVINRKVIDKYAVGVSGELKRVFFLAPRENNEYDSEGTSIGTFYYMFDGDPDKVEVTEDELTEALNQVNAACPNLHAAKDEIIRLELGIMPALGENERGPILYGSEIIREKDGYVEVLSTKYTTFRSQARHALKACGF